MYRTFNHYQLIGEWACPDFGEIFKCEGIKHLKRIGKLANRRNQAEVQSGIMAAEQKKYRRTWHTDLSFLFAALSWRGVRQIWLSGAVPFVHCNLFFPQSPLFRWAEQKCFSQNVKTENRKCLSGHCQLFTCLSVHQVMFSAMPSYAVHLSVLPSASLPAECYLCSEGFLFYFSW